MANPGETLQDIENKRRILAFIQGSTSGRTLTEIRLETGLKTENIRRYIDTICLRYPLYEEKGDGKENLYFFLDWKAW